MLATTLLCLVVGISDGDTLTARCGAPSQYEQVKVRLQGIDAPESRQAFGNVSKRGLSDLLAGQQVDVRYQKEDRYGRLLGVVFVGGPMVLEVIQEGRPVAGHAVLLEVGQRKREAVIDADDGRVIC